MTLGELFAPFGAAKINGDPETIVSGISVDSRDVRKNDLFVALGGSKSDGNKFIADAIRGGAVAVLSEENVTTTPSIKLSGIRKELGRLSSRIYGEPGNEMTIIGVTGTNGKTTTSLLLEMMFQKLGRRVGYVGTLAYRWNGFSKEAPRTTPEATTLHRMLREMRSENVTHLVMECSSHGVEMGRLNALALDTAVFTNLTQDHLDFHVTMEQYKKAKEKLFTEILNQSLKKNRFAVINIDDPVGAEWAHSFQVPVLTYSIRDAKADVRAENVRLTAEGIGADLKVGTQTLPLSSSLVGEHNVYNLLAAFTAAKAVGVALPEAAKILGSIDAIPGRLERVSNRLGIHVLVDYAHTDDALRNVLMALKPLQKKRMIVVFGCGGDRDRTKRPKMAKVVSELADVALVTSDNPRSEKPEAIIHEIEKGIVPAVVRVDAADLNSKSKNVTCSIADRKKAIEKSLEISQAGDIVLIAGKGHETYQEISGVQHPFDDRVVARQWLEKKAA